MDNFDREFALQYISDSWKAIHGSRPDYSELLKLTDMDLQIRMLYVKAVLNEDYLTGVEAINNVKN